MRTPSRSRTRAFLTLSVLPVAVACGEASGGDDDPTGAGGAAAADEKTTDAPDLSGKADGSPALRELGRLETPHAPGRFEVRAADLDDRILAWRLRGFGGTKLRVTVSSPTANVDPYFAIDGPLPDAAGTVVAFADDATQEDVTATAEVTLPAAGAYRIQVGTYGLFHQQATAAGPVALRVECLENCAPEEPTLAVALAAMEATYGPGRLQGMLSEGIGSLFPDAETAAAIRAQADAAMTAPTFPEAFPVVPIAAIASAQALLERPGTTTPPPGAVEFPLDALLTEACHPTRSSLKPVNGTVPDLQTGSAPDYTIEDCLLQRAQEFANVLNNLALENGSAVVNGATRYETVEDVFTALIDSGHHVRIENNRYFADFLGLSYQGKPIAAPVWLDTGIDVGGETLKLPAPHSHHTIIVEGPVLNATIMYYMGVSAGVSFRAVESARPRWSGERTLYTYDSDTDRDTVIGLMVAAAELRKKWTQKGAGLPALGYGLLGVCNDSTAVLEYGAEGTVTIFPLAHPASDAEQSGGDAIDRALAALPSDVDGFENADALARIRTTLSFEDPAELPFPGLAAQLSRLP